MGHMHAGTLLDIWTGLLNQINGEVRPAGFHAPSAAAVAAIQQCAGVVFTELLQAHLADCNKAATSEGDNDAAEVRAPFSFVEYCSTSILFVRWEA